MSNKKIGVLTSGGDCGGLNAAIRSIFFRAKKLALSFAVIICISISYINYVVQERLDTYQFLVKPGGKFYYDKITGKPNWVEGK